jgi:hypothetical protein
VGLSRCNPTGPNSNGQPDVEDFNAGRMGEELYALSETQHTR